MAGRAGGIQSRIADLNTQVEKMQARVEGLDDRLAPSAAIGDTERLEPGGRQPGESELRFEQHRAFGLV